MKLIELNDHYRIYFSEGNSNDTCENETRFTEFLDELSAPYMVHAMLFGTIIVVIR